MSDTLGGDAPLLSHLLELRTRLMKAMAAFTMRMAKAITDMRPASPRSSAARNSASARLSQG